MSDYNTPNMNDFNQPLSEEITPPKKSSLIVYYVVLTFSLILVLIGLTSTIIMQGLFFVPLLFESPYEPHLLLKMSSNCVLLSCRRRELLYEFPPPGCSKRMPSVV